MMNSRFIIVFLTLIKTAQLESLQEKIEENSK